MATDQPRGLGVTPGELLAGIGGLTLLLSLFMEWYTGKATGDAADEEEGEFLELLGQTAWDAITIFAILLAIIAVAGIVFFAMRLMGALPDLPIAPGLVLAGAGGLALILIIIRLIAVPDLEVSIAGESGKLGEEEGTGVARQLWGPLFGILGALALAFGGFRASIERPGVAARPAGAGAPGAFGGPPVGGGPVAPGGPLGGQPPAAGPGPGAQPAAGAPPTQAAPSPQPAQQAAGQPKADWYPDPHGQARLRYWDGSQWTDQTAD